MRAALLCLLALMLIAAPVGAQAPGIRAVIDCGTLSGQGAVDVMIRDHSLGVVRVVCPAPRGA